MRRREFITTLGGATAATLISWPLPARAQQPAMTVVGYLGTDSPDLRARRLRAFRSGLSEAGYDEGRNLTIEFRWAEGQYDRLATLAADLVQRRVNVIVVNGPAAVAAKAATTTIPIVFVVGFDPVKLGLVTSLNRPGGNLTGVSLLNAELAPKRLALMHELVPTATIMGFLLNPANPNAETLAQDAQAAARTLGLKLHVVHASTERDLDTAFATLVEQRAGALVIGTDGFFVSQSERLAALSVRHAVPAIFQNREFAAAGGLMGYAGSDTDANRLMGAYTGRILKGEKPADLPVQQSTKVELIINLKTAKALGLTVPLIMQMTADEVIE
ncbi:MAG: ABC transporter substrate-binding protein [Xanthobacteraceae bacterium]|jgi:putative ABC transport system substrate-binding protein